MSHERERRVLEIYEALLDVQPEHRQEFLRDACGGDDDLRVEVRALLDVGRDAGEFLETSAADSIAIRSGARLGDYWIEERLGAGGMGVVYRARQLSLERTVALKTILAGPFAKDEVVERFVREARATARIQHPNIAHIYDVGEADGHHYYAMEYLQGPSLAEVIARAGEEVRGKRESSTESSEYINSQVERLSALAEGLEEVHRQGLVHRDVKPSNILLDDKGRYVLVDFGLVRDPEAETLTRSGAQVGTLSYMSPEQVAGSRVGPESDVFSLGVTLYEALTLSPPFDADGEKDADPVPARRRNPRIPRDLETVLSCALQRRPERRYRSAGGLAADLRRFLRGEPVLARRQSFPRRLVRRLWRHKGKLAAALGILLATALGFWLRPPAPGSESPVLPPRPVSDPKVSAWSGTFSPDGSTIAYISAERGVPQVWVKSLRGEDARPITRGEAPADDPRWSPTGEWIAFTRGSSRQKSVWRISPEGAGAAEILPGASHASWSWDGQRLVFEREFGIWTSAADGGDPAPVSGVPAPTYPLVDRYPSFSPDGQWIAYFHPELGPKGDFWIVPAAGGTPLRITEDDCNGSTPRWMPPGDTLVFSSDRVGSLTLWTLRIDGGIPQPLTTGVGDDTQLSVSRDGRKVLYTHRRRTYALEVTDLHGGETLEVLRRLHPVVAPTFSPRGDEIAFFGDVNRASHIFVVPADASGPARQLTAGRIAHFPRWSGDGLSLYYNDDSGPSTFQRLSLADSSSVNVSPGWEAAPHNGARVDPADRRFVYTRNESTGARVSVLRDIQTGDERSLEVLLDQPSWSGDGRTLVGTRYDSAAVVLAFSSVEGMIAVYPLDGAPRDLTRGYAPVWSRDDSCIYFLRNASAGPGRELWSIRPDGEGEKLVIGLPEMQGPIHYDVSPDGEMVWTDLEEGPGELWLLELPSDR